MRWHIAFWCGLAAVLAIGLVALPPGPDREIFAILMLAAGLGKLTLDLRIRSMRKPGPTLASDLVDALQTRPLEGLPGYRRVLGPGRPVTKSLVPDGGSPILKGRLKLATFLLGRDGRDWTDAEIAAVIQATQSAADWLAGEADQWEIPLTIEIQKELVIGTNDAPRSPGELVMAMDEFDSSLEDFEESAAVVRAASGVAAELGFRDLPTLVACLNDPLADDVAVVWMIHSLSQGQSHYLDATETEVPGLRLAVCYVHEELPDAPWRGPIFADRVTIAHELLHAFGATDKYQASTTRYPRGAVSEWEVMLLHHKALGRLRVDPLTAREIGWHPQGPLPSAVEKRNRREGRGQRGGSGNG